MKNLNKLKSALYNQNPGENIENVVYNYKMRVCFTKLGEDGLVDMHEYSRMPEFYKYLTGLNPHNNEEDTRKYMGLLLKRIDSGYYGGRAMYWFLRLRTSNKVIGTFGLVGVDLNNGTAILGKGLSPKYWGKGIMFEAMWVMLKYCFDELRINTINTITHNKNQPNIALMQACGARELFDNETSKLDKKRSNYLELILKKSEINLNKSLAFAKIGSV
jgi:ribosomal-protein-alanine N-acetyltransferase